MLQFYDTKYFRPNKAGPYYCITDVGTHYLLDYSTRYNQWNVRDDPELYDPSTDMTDSVVCWAFCPKTDQILLNMMGRED